MDRKLQVFVSSTYTDLRDERQAAVSAILEAHHIPAGMELFAAGDQSQWELIRRWIDDCDVFMLVLGGRYGTIEAESQKSYIQLEYEYAIEKGKRYFAAVMGDDMLNEKVKNQGLEVLEQGDTKAFKDFHSKVKSKHCRFFNALPELKLIVFQSLADISQDKTLFGWIRANEANDPQIALERMNRLEKRIEELQKWAPDELSNDARLMLFYAGKGNGKVYYSKSMEGIRIRAGSQMIEIRTPRELADYQDAIRELCAAGLLLRCKICGCFTSLKAWLPHERCPIGNWSDNSGPITNPEKETARSLGAR
jgi:hypothetical protein